MEGVAEGWGPCERAGRWRRVWVTTVIGLVAARTFLVIAWSPIPICELFERDALSGHDVLASRKTARAQRQGRASLGVIAALGAGVVGVALPATAASAVTVSVVSRISGATRFDTAIAASQDQFTATGSAKAVVLTRADTYPDALSGGPLAAKVGGPLLLTSSASLPSSVQAEIIRVLPKGATVYILGGTTAVSTSVETTITGLGFAVKRIAGTDRYATAVAVADAMGDPTTVFEATGTNFPDALAGGPAAIKSGGVILLTEGSSQAPATAAYLAAHPGGKHYALGGPAAAADATATPLVGDDRYGTAAGVADMFFPAATTVGVATGTDFPDALAAGPDLAAKGAPLVLVAPTGPVPGGSAAVMLALSTTLRSADVFGGTVSVSDDVATQLGTLVNAGAAAVAANTSAAFTGRYGVLTETATGTSTVSLTQVIDGTNGAVTTYVKPGTAPPATTTVTLAQLKAVPLDAAGLQSAVNTLYKAYDTQAGITTTDPDALFLVNAGQVFLNPVAPPTLRLATYGALAAAPETVVTSEVKDSTGRSGIAITAKVTGSTPASDGTISYLFDPATGLPLEDAVTSSTGAIVDRITINSITTTNTLPTNPYL
jgi:putative cell wall-binding protein